MSEPVVIWRPGTVKDRYDNDVAAAPVPLMTIDADVAPYHPEEPSEVGSDAVVAIYSVYHRSAAPTGIESADLVEIRSPLAPDAPLAARRAHLLPIDGKPREWRSKAGIFKGEHFNVKAVQV